MARNIMGVDLGGTRMRVARFDENLNIAERVEDLTRAEEGPDSVIRRMLELTERIFPEDDDTVIGISAPGPVDPDSGVIVAPPNLPGWHNVPLADEFREHFDRPVRLNNDANVAALAERELGAARGYDHVIYITVSTGIGGGIISHGKLITGARGLAGEVGHLIIAPAAGLRGSVEKLAAGPALVRETLLRLRAGTESIIPDLVEGDLSRVDGPVIGEAAKRGDSLAREMIARTGKLVGVLIANLMHLFNPEIVIVGGGISANGELLFAPMRESVKAYTIDRSYWEDTPIVPAELGDDVCLYGAAALWVEQPDAG